MREDKLIQAFQESIKLEALLIYGLSYSRLPKSSQKAVREIVMEYYVQKIHDLTEENNEQKMP